jgi:O-antigen/teichoic acid export membrane protein
MYSLMQVATVIGYNSDYIVISQILGAKAVAEYAVPIKMFTIVGSLMLIMLSPIWPAYSEAMARGDWAWVQATLKRSLVAGLCITISSGAVFVVFGGTMIARWTGGRILPSTILLFALAIWGIVGGVSACVGTFLAASSIRFQAISAIAAAAANLLLSIYLTKSIGVSGVVFGSIIAQSVVLIPGLVLTRRILRSASTCA